MTRGRRFQFCLGLWCLLAAGAHAADNSAPSSTTQSESDKDWINEYYSGKKVPVSGTSIAPIVTVPVSKAATRHVRSKRADDTVNTGDTVIPPAEDRRVAAAPGQSVPNDSVSLPPGMEKGVSDLEAGLGELQLYSGTMAAHLKRTGIRGFLAVPPSIKEEGQAVGRKLGGGVRGIVDEVGKDMVNDTSATR